MSCSRAAALAAALAAAPAARAQEGPRWISYADRFFEEADYYRAITFYKLAAFDGLDEEAQVRVGFRVVESFRLAGRFADAAAEAGLLAERLPDRFRPRARLLAGEAYLLGRQPGFAQVALESAAAGLGGEGDGVRASFLLAYALAEQGRYHEAGTAFGKLNEAAAPLGRAAAGAARVAERYAEGAPSRSVALAAVLSAVPGLGQLYAGAWQEALLSLAVNGVLGFITYDSVRRATPDNWVSAALWISVTSTFYFGNMYAAGVAARRFNEDAATQARMEMAEVAFAPAFGGPPPEDWRELR